MSATTSTGTSAGTSTGSWVAAPPEAPERPEAPAPRRVSLRQAAGHALRGIRFPIAVFACWRLVQLAFLWASSGPLVETAYRYDGAHYLRILHYGYWNPRPQMPSHAFFPGISWLSSPLYWLTGSDAATVHVVATVTALAAFVAVWGATKTWRDERTARLAVVLMAVFPSSLFLWSFYSEGLFIALSAGAVWADRRDRKGLAALCLAGVACTRSVGILVAVVLVVASVVRRRGIDRWAVAYLAAGVAGMAAVSLMMWHQLGDPLAWLSVQGDWGRTLSWPWETVWQGVENLWPEPGTPMVPTLLARQWDLWCAAIVIFGIGYAALSRRDRFPMETWMLGVALMAPQLVSGVLASFNRFALADWVLFPIYASLALRLAPKWRWPLLAVAVGAAVWTSYGLVDRIALNRFIG